MPCGPSTSSDVDLVERRFARRQQRQPSSAGGQQPVDLAARCSGRGRPAGGNRRRADRPTLPLSTGLVQAALPSAIAKCLGRVAARRHAADNDLRRHAVGADPHRLVGLEDEAAQQDRFAERQPPVGQGPHIFVAMLARGRDDDEVRRVAGRDEQLLLGRRFGERGGRMAARRRRKSSRRMFNPPVWTRGAWQARERMRNRCFDERAGSTAGG